LKKCRKIKKWPKIEKMAKNRQNFWLFFQLLAILPTFGHFSNYWPFFQFLTIFPTFGHFWNVSTRDSLGSKKRYVQKKVQKTCFYFSAPEPEKLNISERSQIENLKTREPQRSRSQKFLSPGQL